MFNSIRRINLVYICNPGPMSTHNIVIQAGTMWRVDRRSIII